MMRYTGRKLVEDNGIHYHIMQVMAHPYKRLHLRHQMKIIFIAHHTVK